MTPQPKEYIIDEELASLIEDALMNNPECKKCPNEGSGYNGAIVSHIRSRPAPSLEPGDSDIEMTGIWMLCSIICCLFTLTTLHGWYKIGTDDYYIGMDLAPYLIWSGFIVVLDLICIHYLGKYLKGALNDPRVNT